MPSEADLSRSPASASGSPAIAAWSARRWCAGWRAKTARSSPSAAASSICATRPTVERLDRATNRPDAVFLAAAKVGGILANDTLSGGFPLRQSDDRDERHRRRASQPASRSCCSSARPASIRKLAPQPITEDALLTGPLEPTNEWYAIAKIAGIKLCQAYRRQYGCDFISAMPTNLYGPGDNFDLDLEPCAAGPDPQGARGQAARATRAMTIWGTGTPRREFLHVDDCADALVFLMKNYSGDEHVNVGSGEDITIVELARLVGRGGRLRRRDRASTRPSPTARRARA